MAAPVPEPKLIGLDCFFGFVTRDLIAFYISIQGPVCYLIIYGLAHIIRVGLELKLETRELNE